MQAVGALGLLADNIQNGVDELSTLRVVTLRPVVTGTTLTEDEVVRAEEVAEGARAHRVHGAGLEINEDSTGHVLVRADLVVVHVDPLELKVVVALVQSIRLNAVLSRDDLPELGTWMKRSGSGDGVWTWQMRVLYRFGYRTVNDDMDELWGRYNARKHVDIPGRFGGGRFHAFCWTTISTMPLAI